MHSQNGCARFENAKIQGADFSAGRLDRAEFNHANCRGAKFISAKIPYADFSHAYLRNADFSHADLTQSVLHSVDDSGVIWKGANRKLVDLTDKDLAMAEKWVPPKPVE